MLHLGTFTVWSFSQLSLLFSFARWFGFPSEIAGQHLALRSPQHHPDPCLPLFPTDTCLRSWMMGWPTKSTTLRWRWTSRGQTLSSDSRSWLSAWWPTNWRMRTMAMTSTSKTQVRKPSQRPVSPTVKGPCNSALLSVFLQKQRISLITCHSSLIMMLSQSELPNVHVTWHHDWSQ